MVKLSIIVPVYNVEKYIDRCVESILNQEEKDFELILIDDGSTDTSGLLCDKYAEIDNRVKVIHKKNEGVSVARNIGIELASGTHLGFVDSDDWIDKTMYLDMLKVAQNLKCDIVMCDAITVYDNEETQIDTFESIKCNTFFNKEDIKPEILKEIAGSTWRCIYASKIIKENNIRFPINLKLSEDRIFNLYSIGNSKKIFYIKNTYYRRFMRKGSAVTKYYPDLNIMVKLYTDKVKELLRLYWTPVEPYLNEYKKQFFISYLTVVYNLFHEECKLSIYEKYIQIKEFINEKEVVEILETLEIGDFKLKLLKKKKVFLLMILGKLYQIKNNR